MTRACSTLEQMVSYEHEHATALVSGTAARTAINQGIFLCLCPDTHSFYPRFDPLAAAPRSTALRKLVGTASQRSGLGIGFGGNASSRSRLGKFASIPQGPEPMPQLRIVCT